MTALLDAALAYARLGFAAFPLRRGEKKPLVAGGFHAATTDPDALARAFSRPANLGLAIPDGFVIVDMDGLEGLAQVQALDLETPATSRQRTPRGGAHLVYRLPPGIVARQTVAEIAPKVDTRAAGAGYIVAAPSVVSGKTYQWEVPLSEEDIADAPSWLVERFAVRTGSLASEAARGIAAARLKSVLEAMNSLEPWRLVEGSRNDQLATIAGTLLYRDVPILLAWHCVVALNRVFGAPALADEELARTFHSMLERKLNRGAARAA